MDIFILFVMAVIIVLLIAATGRAVNNAGRLNVRADGIPDGELLRMLRESQQHETTRLVNGDTVQIPQPEGSLPVSETTPIIPIMADQGLQS